MPNFDRDDGDDTCGCAGYGGHQCRYHREQDELERARSVERELREDDAWHARLEHVDALLGGPGVLPRLLGGPEVFVEPLFDDPDPEFDEEHGTHLQDTFIEPEMQRALRRGARNERALDRAQKQRCEACARVAREHQDARIGLSMLQSQLDQIAAGQSIAVRVERVSETQVRVEIGKVGTLNPELGALGLERLAALVRNIEHFPLPPPVPTAQRGARVITGPCGESLPRGSFCDRPRGHAGAHGRTR